MWVATDRGLYYLDEENGNQFIRQDQSNGEVNLKNQNIKSIFLDDHDNMWIGNHEGGLHYWDSKKKRTISFLLQKDVVGSLSNNNIRTIAQDKDGQIWVGTFDGLNIYQPNSNNFRIYKKNRYKKYWII